MGVALASEWVYFAEMGVFGAPLIVLFVIHTIHGFLIIIILISSAIVVRHDRRLDTPWEPHSWAHLTGTTFW